jgi:polyisoprenyl-teichoic acid--peptidoglycan teichoic acid transferase
VLSLPSVFIFLRRFVIALLLVSALTAAVFKGADAYGKKQFDDQSHTVHIADGVLAQTDPGKPANFLLIGSDVRAADETPAEKAAYGSAADVGGGGRSDVMMVLHIDPTSHTGMLVSFPRDLVVTIPGHGKNLLNAAYAYGGPSLVIETLQTEFKPLRINHYLEVDFRSFKSIVDTIGHIHIYFPTPVQDPYTGLAINQSGCVSLNGDQALAYARSRHYYIPKNLQSPAPWQPHTDSQGNISSSGWLGDPLEDLDRIPRQQYFLRTISQAATDKTGSNPTAILGLLTDAFKNLSHDQNLSFTDLKELALTFRGFSPSKVEMSTLPWAAATGSFSGHVVAKFPDSIAVINRLANFTPPKAAVVKPLESDKVKIKVVNGSGLKGAGTSALDTFVAVGFKSAGAAEDADRSDYKTQIRYAPGKFNEGYTVAVATGTLNLVEAASAKNTLGGDVLLIVGTDYLSLKHRFDLIPHPANLPSTTATSSTSIAPAPTTTTTTVPRQTVDTRFVPVDPTTGGPLVGCPTGK